MAELFNQRNCLQPEEITAYLAQALPDERRFAVENHLLDCPLCDAAVEGFAQADPSTSKRHLAEIEAQLSTPKSQQSISTASEAKVRTLPRWRNWAAAVAAIALLVTAAIIYSNQGPTSTTELFAQAYTPYESPFAGTRSATDNESPLNKGLEAYHAGNYQSALQYFETALASAPEESIAHLHAGMANLQLGHTSAAIDHLTTVRVNAPVLYGAASWYLALAQLKAGDIAQCRAVLQQILPTEKEYHLQAQQLLKQLNRVEE